jgi:hypothetical protein
LAEIEAIFPAIINLMLLKFKPHTGYTSLNEKQNKTTALHFELVCKNITLCTGM